MEPNSPPHKISEYQAHMEQVNTEGWENHTHQADKLQFEFTEHKISMRKEEGKKEGEGRKEKQKAHQT